MGVPLEISLSKPLNAYRDSIVKMEEKMCLHHFSLLEDCFVMLCIKNDYFLGFFFHLFLVKHLNILSSTTA